MSFNDISSPWTRRLTGNAADTVSFYDITATTARNLTELYTHISTASNWPSDTIPTGLTFSDDSYQNGRHYTINYTGSSHLFLNCRFTLTDNREGWTTYTINNSGSGSIFLQLFGASTANRSDSSAQVNIGRVRGGRMVGGLRIIYNDTNNTYADDTVGSGSIFHYKTGSSGVRPYDRRNEADWASRAYGAQRYYHLTGYAAGSFNTPQNGEPAVIWDIRGNIGDGGSGQSGRFDVDIDDGTMSGTATFAFINNTTNSRVGIFVHSRPGANFTIGPGSYVYAGSTSVNGPQLQQISTATSTDPVLGHTVREYPQSYLTNFKLSTNDDFLTQRVFPGGTSVESQSSSNVGISYIVRNYPDAGISPYYWGFYTDNTYRQTSHFIPN